MASTWGASVAALVLAGTAGALADSAPSFDCDRADGTVETLICERDDLARIDRRLSERFFAAVETARGLDEDAEGAEEALRAEQRGFIAGRNDCWKASDVGACVADAMLRREGELVADWLLEAPVAEAIYVCGSGARELVLAFFDTELPAARAEFGDGVGALSLTAAGSGMRYEGAFGRTIWLHGEEATLEWVEGEEERCDLSG